MASNFRFCRCKGKSFRAFTLIEIMIVVAIISLITSIGSHTYKKLRLEAQADAFINELKIMEAALRMYYYDNNGKTPSHNSGKPPTTLNFQNISDLQPYFPPDFKNTKTPFGGRWYYYESGNDLAIACENINDSEALKIAEAKLTNEDPQNLDRIQTSSKNSAYLFYYYIKRNLGSGNSQNFF